MSDTALFLLFIIPGTIFLGLNDVLIRNVLRRGTVAPQLLVAFEFISVGVLTGLILLFSGVPELKPGFWSAFAATVGLNTFAQWAWYTAFKKEEASLISPFRLVTPPLVIVTGFLILGEMPTLAGAAGILLTVAGLWFFLESEAKHAKERLLAVVKRPGVLLALWGAVSFAFSLPFDKQLVVASSPLLAVSGSFTAVGLGNFVLWGTVMRRRSGSLREVPWHIVLLIPFVHTAAAFLSYAALNYALVAYVGSVKRLWSLWAVIFAGTFLKEGNIRRKLAATAVMLAGIALTVVLG